MEIVNDYPKLESPFVRKEVDGDYVVVDEVNEDYDWVFEDDSVIAVEKLHGTNVSILKKNGRITGVWNRKNHIYPYDHTKDFITKGIINSVDKGWVDVLTEGQHFGELVGPKVNGNPYHLDQHLWIPFEKAKRWLRYKSWGEYPKTYEAISHWFKGNLIPLFYSKMHGIGFTAAQEEHEEVEGVVFYHSDGRKAKLRRDMFPWYEGRRHKQ